VTTPATIFASHYWAPASTQWVETQFFVNISSLLYQPHSIPNDLVKKSAVLNIISDVLQDFNSMERLKCAHLNRICPLDFDTIMRTVFKGRAKSLGSPEPTWVTVLDIIETG
jgi:hypothetical protein